MKALVTGGAGFIGSTVVDRLVASGYAVAVVDDLSNGRSENLSSALAAGDVTVHEADIRDAAAMRDITSSERPEIVMHLAAQIDVRVSVADPVRDAGVNVIGSLNVFEAARAAGVRKVVMASSGGTVFGEAKVLPIKETARGRPESPYGISKRVLHDYLAFYRRVYGLRSAVLALSNVCGPRQDPFGEAGVVAMFLGAMLEGKPTTIYGDGSQTRDFVFVGDVADAFVRAATKGHGVYNIGTGVETSVLELWRLCAKVTSYTHEPRYAEARPGELQRSSLDASRAKAGLGWEPATSLEEAISQTAAFLSGR
jgi:UDP-glucose 4-epimerase